MIPLKKYQVISNRFFPGSDLLKNIASKSNTNKTVINNFNTEDIIYKRNKPFKNQATFFFFFNFAWHIHALNLHLFVINRCK